MNSSLFAAQDVKRNAMFRQEIIKIQVLKCSQILYAHEPYFLTLAHIYILLKKGSHK